MYFIACFEKIDSSQGLLDIGDLRVFGYFSAKKDAFNSLKENKCDLHEFLYNYAVVEKIEEGLHPDAEEEYFFKFNKMSGGFELIDKPIELFHCRNFTIG